MSDPEINNTSSDFRAHLYQQIINWKLIADILILEDDNNHSAIWLPDITICNHKYIKEIYC